jgi:hypothetical protein
MLLNFFMIFCLTMYSINNWLSFFFNLVQVSNQEAVDIARSFCVGSNRQGPSKACKKLVDLSASRGSIDDISVMIIELHNYIWSPIDTKVTWLIGSTNTNMITRHNRHVILTCVRHRTVSCQCLTLTHVEHRTRVHLKTMDVTYSKDNEYGYVIVK